MRGCLRLEAQQWLECLQHLHRSLETDFSRLDFSLSGSLRHDGPNQVEGQDVSPNLFPDKLRRFATQDVHLQTDFDIP